MEKIVKSSKDVFLDELMKKFRKQKSKVATLTPISALALTACGSNSEDNGVSLSIAENSASLVVGSVAADGGDPVGTTYILSGTDAESFILSDSGELSLKQAANFENKSSFDVTVTASSTTVDDLGVEVTTDAVRAISVGVQNVNDAPTGLPTISSAAEIEIGSILSLDTKTLADEDGIGEFSYAWKSDGVDIVGETGSTYTVVESDADKDITATVTYKDLAGTTETVGTSGSVTLTLATKLNVEENSASLVVGSVTAEGEDATKTTYSISGTDAEDFTISDSGELSLKSSANFEEKNSYDITVTASTVSVDVSGDEVSTETIREYVINVGNVNEAATGDVEINGTPTEGETLTAVTSSIADPDGLGSFSYQWLRDGLNIEGANESQLTLSQADVGNQISLNLSYVDGSGATETFESVTTSSVENVNDAPSGSLTISGSAEKGSVLTLDSSSIGDEDGLGTFTTVWKSDGSLISGASDSTFTLTPDQVGKAVSAVISYTDGQGTAETVTSASTSSVKDVIVESVGAFSITNSGTSASPILDFYLDASKDPGGDGVGSFDVVLDFTATEASYDSFSFASGLIGNANDTDASEGQIYIGAIAFPNFTDLSTPLFTMNMIDLDTSAEFAIYIHDVSVDGTALDGTTSLIA